MSATATATATSLLTSIGLNLDRLNTVSDGVELVVDEFDAWRSWEIGNAPVMGSICFRDPESDLIAA